MNTIFSVSFVASWFESLNIIKKKNLWEGDNAELTTACSMQAESVICPYLLSLFPLLMVPLSPEGDVL